MEKGEKKDIKKKKSTQRTLLLKYCFSNADRCEHQSPLKAGVSNKCTRFRRPTRSCSSEKGRDKPAKTVGFLPLATANDHCVFLKPSSISLFFFFFCVCVAVFTRQLSLTRQALLRTEQYRKWHLRKGEKKKWEWKQKKKGYPQKPQQQPEEKTPP